MATTTTITLNNATIATMLESEGLTLTADLKTLLRLVWTDTGSNSYTITITQPAPAPKPVEKKPVEPTNVITLVPPAPEKTEVQPMPDKCPLVWEIDGKRIVDDRVAVQKVFGMSKDDEEKFIEENCKVGQIIQYGKYHSCRDMYEIVKVSKSSVWLKKINTRVVASSTLGQKEWSSYSSTYQIPDGTYDTIWRANKQETEIMIRKSTLSAYRFIDQNAGNKIYNKNIPFFIDSYID